MPAQELRQQTRRVRIRVDHPMFHMNTSMKPNKEIGAESSPCVRRQLVRECYGSEALLLWWISGEIINGKRSRVESNERLPRRLREMIRSSTYVF